MTSILYFAYGSNMFSDRLRYRVPSCQPQSIARLSSHSLRFHKKSNDGSLKCDAFLTSDPDDNIYGVIYRIPKSEKAALDQAEGLGSGYNEKTVSLLIAEHEMINAQTYVADPSAIASGLPIYSWYKDFVVQGAIENNIPTDYVANNVMTVSAIPDPNVSRDRRRRAEVKS